MKRHLSAFVLNLEKDYGFQLGLRRHLNKIIAAGGMDAWKEICKTEKEQLGHLCHENTVRKINHKLELWIQMSYALLEQFKKLYGEELQFVEDNEQPYGFVRKDGKQYNQVKAFNINVSKINHMYNHNLGIDENMKLLDEYLKTRFYPNQNSEKFKWKRRAIYIHQRIRNKKSYEDLKQKCPCKKRKKPDRASNGDECFIANNSDCLNHPFVHVDKSKRPYRQCNNERNCGDSVTERIIKKTQKTLRSASETVRSASETVRSDWCSIM